MEPSPHLISGNIPKQSQEFALSITTSKEESGKSHGPHIHFASYLKSGSFVLYTSQSLPLRMSAKMSMLVIFWKPSSNISSLRARVAGAHVKDFYFHEWTTPSSRSLTPLYRWYQSKGSESLSKDLYTCCISPPNTMASRRDSWVVYYYLKFRNKFSYIHLWYFL